MTPVEKAAAGLGCDCRKVILAMSGKRHKTPRAILRHARLKRWPRAKHIVWDLSEYDYLKGEHRLTPFGLQVKALVQGEKG